MLNLLVYVHVLLLISYITVVFYVHHLPPQSKEHQEANKSLKKRLLSSSLSPQSSPELVSSNPPHSNLFLTSNLLKDSPHLNGVVQSTVQDAPLALITKPRSDSSKTPDKPLLEATSPCFNTPINLSTGARLTSSGPSASDRASTQRESHSARAGSLLQGKMFRESGIPSSKDSDDSGEYEEEDLSESLSGEC